MAGKLNPFASHAAPARQFVGWKRSGSVGIGASPSYALDVNVAQAVARLNSTSSSYVSVLELRNGSGSATTLGATQGYWPSARWPSSRSTSHLVKKASTSVFSVAVRI